VIVENSKDLKVNVGDERRDSGSRTRNAVPPPTIEVLEEVIGLGSTYKIKSMRYRVKKFSRGSVR
jgi:hypothetical protein